MVLGEENIRIWGRECVFLRISCFTKPLKTRFVILTLKNCEALLFFDYLTAKLARNKSAKSAKFNISTLRTLLKPSLPIAIGSEVKLYSELLYIHSEINYKTS